MASFEPDTPSPPARRWPRRALRFSVRAMLAAILVVGSGLGWLIDRAHVQRDAVAAIRRAGGLVLYDWQYKDGRMIANGKLGWPRRLVEFLGVDALASVTMVTLPRGSDREMAALGRLSRVDTLVLDWTSITDDGVAQLGRLKDLRWLTVTGRFADADLLRLPPRLRGLTVLDTEVTDDGLAHLKRFKELEVLGLGRARISDAGLVHLAGFPALTFLELDGTQITDAGLVHLDRLPRLGRLSIKGTRVTPAGVTDLRKRLPGRFSLRK